MADVNENARGSGVDGLEAAAAASGLPRLEALSGGAVRSAQLVAALTAAARSGDMQAMARLVARGADMSAAGPDGRNALQEAAAGGHREAVAWLLARGCAADAVAPRPSWGRWLVGLFSERVFDRDRAGAVRALVRAARDGDEAMVGLLLEAGAAVDARAGDDDAPLIAAILGGHDAIAARLVAAGADLQAPWCEPIVHLRTIAEALACFADRLPRTVESARARERGARLRARALPAQRAVSEESVGPAL